MPFKRASGFTLIELIIGIVVFAIAMALLSSLLLPQAKRSVDPIFQRRATELANSLINEIQGKAYCENATPWLAVCDSHNLGPDNGEVRNLFDDVDDYDGLTIAQVHLNSSSSYQELYLNFSLSVKVFYDTDLNGLPDPVDNWGAKLILVTVTTPNGEALDFASYRSNF